MAEFLQFPIPFYISLTISLVVWIVFTLLILNISIEPFGSSTITFPKSLLFGVITGFTHGIIARLLTYFFSLDNSLGIVIAGFSATEILLLIILTGGIIKHHLNLPKGLRAPAPPKISAYLTFIFIAISWYAILSLILAVPTFIIVVTNRIIVNFATFD